MLIALLVYFSVTDASDILPRASELPSNGFHGHIAISNQSLDLVCIFG
jgi:hypothetical protein